MNNLAFVVIGYNRGESFSRLLNSISNIVTDRKDITLVITLERGSNKEVNSIAENFKWEFGEKIIVKQSKKLGLRKHFIWVGDQTEKFENVIFLEDDLFVSPYIIDAAEQFIDYYKEDQSIAGVSLYSPLICEFSATRFYQLEDGYDVYFLKHPYWGNIWSKDKWLLFKEWLQTYERKDELLPKYVKKWKDTSFKVVFIQYLIETGKYMVFPRISLVNNLGYSGVHNKTNSTTFNVPILLKPINYRFSDLYTSLAIYDEGFEISPLIIKKMNRKFEKYDFDVDLKGTKTYFPKEYVLTTRFSSKPIFTFSGNSKPEEYDVCSNNNGNQIVLSRIDDICIHKNSDYWFNDVLKNNMFGNRYATRMLKKTIIYILINIKRIIVSKLLRK